jgi:hypothetical protein
MNRFALPPLALIAALTLAGIGGLVWHHSRPTLPATAKQREPEADESLQAEREKALRRAQEQGLVENWSRQGDGAELWARPRFDKLHFAAKQSTCELAFAYLFRVADGPLKLGDARRLLLYDGLTGRVIGRYGVNGLTLD